MVANKSTSARSSDAELPTWNLTDLYPAIDSAELARDIQLLTDSCRAFRSRYEGKVKTLKGDEFAAAIREYEIIEDLEGKIGSYAQLVYSGDMAKPEHGQFYQNISEQLTALGSDMLFFTLDINKLGDKQMAGLLRDSESLRHYQPWLREVRAWRKYQLSDELEKLLHEKSVAGRAAWSRLFDETLSGLRFDYDGESLTSEQILNNLSSPNRKVRKKSAKLFGKVLGENKQTFALITNTLAKDKEIEDNWRGFGRPIDSRNASNSVEGEVVEALIGSVKRRYPDLSHRYYALKAKWFETEQLRYWDRNAPLPNAPETKYGWDDAKELVLSSYMAFSPTLAKIGRDFFDKGWIDVPPRPGKAPGAFAHPTVPSAHPYLLLNYQGKTRDVMTLAHELGHGVHQVLSAGQGALMADTPLTLAETASVFGEQLTFREILKREQSPEARKFLLASKVEDMLNTVVRQTAFCDFEIRLHDERRTGELTPDRIGEIWLDVQGESLGPAIRFGKAYRHYWSYIPHFIHSPFYVYAYAFGDCLVNSLYAVYQREKDQGRAQQFEEKYLAMLRAGGTLRHKELLAPFGLDAGDPQFWDEGLSVISGFIDELETL